MTKNHGKIDPMKLASETRRAMLLLAQCLREEIGLHAVQVTFDDDCLQGSDVPPTIHVITRPGWDAAHWGVN